MATEPESATKKALMKLEDRLTCAICLDSYKDPKLLQCFHVFCEKCLIPLVVQDQQGQLSVRCPTCRRSTLLPAASVSGLQSAFHIHHLFEIQEAFEESKEHPSTEHVDDSGSEQLLSCPKKPPFHCPFHEDRELELYCETCDELICFQCTLRLHTGHQFDLVSDVFEKHKNEITASLEPVEKQLGCVDKALEQLDIRCDQITDQRAVVEANIHKTFQRVHEALEVRRTELIGKLNLMTQQMMKTLAAQRDETEMAQIQLKSCVEFVRESLRTGRQREVMNMKKLVVTQIKKLTANFKPDTLKTTELPNMKFSTVAVSLPIQQFGKVCFQQIAPEKCHINTEGIQAVEVEKETTTILQVADEDGEACVIPVESVNCEVVSEITAHKIKCQTKQLGNGQFEISYKPVTVGKHDLHITVEGKSIRGSPFPTIAYLGCSTKPLCGLKAPWGVAVNQRGEVIVAENERHCVSIFSPNGEKLTTFGLRGSSRGDFYHPRGVAVDDEDSILVADYGNHRIQKFTNHAKFLKTVGKKGTGCLRFCGPIGVAVHPHNKKVYVVEHQNHRIQILNPDLSFSGTFGRLGNANGHFQYPRDIAFDGAGNVYVADSGKHCIQVFTAKGAFLSTFGHHGKCNGQLNLPTGVVIVGSMICVTEESNHRVSVFSVEGRFLTMFGESGSDEERLNGPQGIAAVKDNRKLFVSDTCNGRVYVYNNMI